MGDFETEMDRIYTDDESDEATTPVAESSKRPKSEVLPPSPPRLHSSHSYNHDVDLAKAYSPDRPKSLRASPSPSRLTWRMWMSVVLEVKAT